MLTARGEETERVRGLATGADDYIVKPFFRSWRSISVHLIALAALPQPILISC